MTTIGEVDVAVYTVPTDQWEADGTLKWSKTTMVLVQAHAGDLTGLGWTYGPVATAGVVADLLAGAIRGRSVHDLPGIHEAMRRAVRNAGRPVSARWRSRRSTARSGTSRPASSASRCTG